MISSPMQHTILLVEDDKESQRIVETALQPMSCVIDIASSESIALHKLLNYKYDLIVLDLDLPDGNGMSLFRKAEALLLTKNINKKKYFIIFSGLDKPKEALKKLRYFMPIDYIQKPAGLEDLRNRILLALNVIPRRACGAN